MKCNAQIIRYMTGKQYKSLPANWDIQSFFSTTLPKIYVKLDIENIEICNGKIISDIHSSDGRVWGGETIIRFCCEKCGQTYFTELPQTLEDLNEWITKKIEEQ